MTQRDDRRDPVRTLELLWGAQPQPTRGPKPGLSLEQIVQAGIRVADAEGLAALSMRKVADDLGFTTMSLYRYVPGKDELLELMVDNAMGPLPDRPSTSDWRSDLRYWARANMAIYRAHPWVLEVPITHPPMGPHEVAWMDWSLQSMVGSGLSGEEMLGVLMLLTGYVRGQAQLVMTLAEAETTTGVSEGEWDSAYGGMLQKVVAEGRHPGLTYLVRSGVFESADVAGEDEWLADTFEFGLDRILDGIGSYIERRSRGLDVTG